MTYHLGVDLGTTYTAAAVARDGRAQPATLGSRGVAVPSVVYQGSDELLFGEAAARRAVTEPARVAREFKRRVGDPTPILLGGSPVAAELLMARMLRWAVGQVAETEGAAPASLSVTHPANWGEYKLDLLRQAIRHVDVAVDHYVPEPVAAASFYAAQRDPGPGSVVAVYDLGGGTFDAAVVRAEGNSFRIVGRPDGIERLGGIDFDHAIFRHVVSSLSLDLDGPDGDADDPALVVGLQQLRQDCVEAKEALSAETDVSIPVLLPQRHTEVRLTRQEFESMVRPALVETIVALRRAVESAGVRLDDVKAVLLVGGSSRIPLAAHLVTEQLGRPVAVDANPKDAISLGAALVAWRAARPAPPRGVAAAAAAGGGAAVAGAAAAAAAARPADPRPAPPRPVPPPRTAPAAPAAGHVGAGSGERPAYAAAPGYPPAGMPSGSGPHPAPGGGAGGGAGGNRNLVLAAAGLFALVLLLVALLASQGDDNAGDGGATTTTDSPTTTDDDTTGTTADDTTGGLGDLGDLGDLGGSAFQFEPMEALPGTDWNDDARASYVEQCSSMDEWATEVGDAIDPVAMCGCTYDGVQASGATFADLNAAVTAEAGSGVSNTATAAIQGVAVDCAFETIDVGSITGG